MSEILQPVEWGNPEYVDQYREWASREMERHLSPDLSPEEIDELEKIRQEIAQPGELVPSLPDNWSSAQRVGELSPPTVIEGEAPKAQGPLGILQEKQMLKRKKERKESAPKQATEMLVVFNDVQLLKETDQEALGAFLKYVEANKKRITHLVANGDIADFTAQSGFDKDLNAMNSTNDEIESVRWLIDHLSTLLPDAEKVFIEGNHSARWSNLINAEMGNEPWIKTLDEQFGLTENGWKHVTYGSGQFYEWHDRIFWHGHRSGAVSNIPKLELQDAGVSVTTAHVNRNMFHETTDARGARKTGITHGGFSKDNLGFMKKANTGWSQGFGVYFYDEKTQTETPYMVTMAHRQPRFIGPDGNLYSGEGWSIPGFETEVKRGRGKPRKS